MRHFLLSVNMCVYLAGVIIDVLLKVKGFDSNLALSCVLALYVAYFTYNEWDADCGETS
jgi:hypothetical protein